MEYRRCIIVTHDVVAVAAAWVIAYFLRFDLMAIPLDMLQMMLRTLPVVIAIQLLSCHAFGLYRGYWRFASLPDLLRIIQSTVSGTALITVALWLGFRMENVPRSVIPLYLMLSMGGLGGSRFIYRWLRDYWRVFQSVTRVMIVGAGPAGESLVRDLLKQVDKRYKPVVFVDDDMDVWGRELHGVRVQGNISMIPSLFIRYNIDLIFIAVPKLTSTKMREIIDYAQGAQLPCRILPSFHAVMENRVDIKSFCDVRLEDLLGRDPVQLDWERIEKFIKAQTILVTGGGGSIGSELVKQIARLKPLRIVIVDHAEFNLYTITQTLNEHFPDILISAHLVDVSDLPALQSIFLRYRIDRVFHAAAYKHVPLLEYQARAAVMNNILGTQYVAECAIAHGVSQVVLISTDKAVCPSNIMGASKRCAEIVCQYYNQLSETHFITVRFGNVLGSAGSVIPLFQQQLKAGGPLTVTHPEVTRFFMTIPEACQLILQASSVGNRGDVLVLDMGEPINIRYLAEKMIQLSGLSIEAVGIRYIGLRSGEKLQEELFYDKETLLPTGYKKLFRATPMHNDAPFSVPELLMQLQSACMRHDEERVVALLKVLVPEYSPINVPDYEEI